MKKFMVKYENETTGKTNTIHFGAKNYDDFTITNDEERKRLYKLRHVNDKIDNLKYAGSWSYHLLWNKKTIEASINDMMKRFNIKITNNLIYYNY